MTKENFLSGECAIKIELHLEKEICNILKETRSISTKIQVREDSYIYVKTNVWCDNIEVVDKEDLPLHVKPVSFNELEI